MLVRRFAGDRKFPFPKSLYAVEDALRIAVGEKPSGTILDFFFGSGTTAHAVMRLNRQDGGRRQCISITNNEVAADEQGTLRKAGLSSGDLRRRYENKTLDQPDESGDLDIKRQATGGMSDKKAQSWIIHINL